MTPAQLPLEIDPGLLLASFTIGKPFVRLRVIAQVKAQPNRACPPSSLSFSLAALLLLCEIRFHIFRRLPLFLSLHVVFPLVYDFLSHFWLALLLRLPLRLSVLFLV